MKRGEFVKKRREMNAKPVRELIELLYSDDLETRFFAEMALRDASGT
jgi:hypothetical protein